MFRANILAAMVVAIVPLGLLPLLGAQSQAPKAHSVSNFSQSRSYLGIAVLDVTDERAKALGLKEPQGVEVTVVKDDSPAAKAGVQRGDVILEYNGQQVEGDEQFVRLVQETPEGRKATLQIWRNRSKLTLTAVIGSRQNSLEIFSSGIPIPIAPPAMIFPDMPYDTFSLRNMALGVETEALTSQLAEFFGVKEGVLVRAVNKGSAAESAGLKAGDVITKVGGQAVSSPRSLGLFLRKSGGSVTLTVVRNHKELTLDVKLAKNLMRMGEFPCLAPELRQTL
jgi:serine protease Do